jgi:hypothetical protein
MSISAVTRRVALSSLGAFAIIPTGFMRPARAQKAVKLRDIRVDVSPLRASAGDPTAAWVEQELPRDLAQALAPYMAPAERDGATLVVRIQYVYLGPSAGGMGMSGSARDAIEGLLAVRGPGHGAASETRLRATASYSGSSDQALVEEGYHSRVIALAQAFATWTPRQLGF